MAKGRARSNLKKLAKSYRSTSTAWSGLQKLRHKSGGYLSPSKESRYQKLSSKRFKQHTTLVRTGIAARMARGRKSGSVPRQMSFRQFAQSGLRSRDARRGIRR